jgi:tetratricopeptide (TPR) repeat protein
VFTRRDFQRPSLLHGQALGLSLALSLSGQVPEALALFEQTLAQYSFPGLLMSQNAEATRLGELYLLAGRFDAALQDANQIFEYACSHHERRRQAWALRLLGEITVGYNLQAFELAESYYQQALTLAQDLGMRPLQAHTHSGLGTLYAQTEQPAKAYAALSTAKGLYRDMDMTFWLPQVEAQLAKLLFPLRDGTPP